jgi:hypothetical protein
MVGKCPEVAKLSYYMDLYKDGMGPVERSIENHSQLKLQKKIKVEGGVHVDHVRNWEIPSELGGYFYKNLLDRL